MIFDIVVIVVVLVVVVVDIVVDNVVDVVVVVVVPFFVPLFLSLHLDFFFSQQELTFLVMTDKGIKLDCLTVVQFSWVKSSQVEASVELEFVFGLPHITKTLSQL